MSIIPNPNTPQLKAIDTYLKSLFAFDFAVLKTLTTDDYHMIMAPGSMGVLAKTKDEDLARLEKLKESVKGEELKFTVYDVVDGQGNTWIHGKSETFDIESVLLFTFGTGVNALKIAQIISFTDSKKYLEVSPKS